METEATTYLINLKGHLDSSKVSEFGGFAFVREINGDGNPATRLLGSVKDRAELDGILAKLRDLGNTIITLCPIKTNEIYQPNTIIQGR